METGMAKTRDVQGAAEKFAQATRDSYEKVMDHTMAMQERNFRFAQGVVSDSVAEVRRQAESNQRLTQDLLERAEKQRGALRTVVGEGLEAYMDLAFAPLSYYREGLATAARAGK